MRPHLMLILTKEAALLFLLVIIFFLPKKNLFLKPQHRTFGIQSQRSGDGERESWLRIWNCQP